MPSPFPGMDPWLEDPDLFPDIHDSLITYLREAINAQLPEPFYARSATRVWIDDGGESREPDVAVNSPHGRPDAVAVLEPFGASDLLVIAPNLTPVEEKFLEVRSGRGNRLVTSIEVLSPSDKRHGGKGHLQYLKKQQECREAGAALVEIDLLRAGTHTTAVPYEQLLRRAPNFCYHVCSSGRAVLGHYIVAAVALAQRLPRVPVPLDPGVPPLFVELQPLLDRAYDTGRYARHLDYDHPLRPPLTDAEQEWANDILSKRTPTPTGS